MKMEISEIWSGGIKTCKEGETNSSKSGYRANITLTIKNIATIKLESPKIK